MAAELRWGRKTAAIFFHLSLDAAVSSLSSPSSVASCSFLQRHQTAIDTRDETFLSDSPFLSIASLGFICRLERQVSVSGDRLMSRDLCSCRCRFLKTKTLTVNCLPGSSDLKVKLNTLPGYGQFLNPSRDGCDDAQQTDREASSSGGEEILEI